MISVRNYKISDYSQIASLYKQGETFGGQFDEDRDSPERLSESIQHDPASILVCELDGAILGTVSLIENVRAAWLFRFAVAHSSDKDAVARALYTEATNILRARGHAQVLVYGPHENEDFAERYIALGFEKGADYTCFWRAI